MTRGVGTPDGFRCVTYPHTTNNIRWLIRHNSWFSVIRLNWGYLVRWRLPMLRKYQDLSMSKLREIHTGSNPVLTTKRDQRKS